MKSEKSEDMENFYNTDGITSIYQFDCDTSDVNQFRQDESTSDTNKL